MSKKVCKYCKHGKIDCFAFGNYGKCKALSDTDFKGKPCPFYKTEKERFEGHVASVQRLEDIDRCDLIITYGEADKQREVWSELGG